MLSLGVLAELWLEFQELEVVVLFVLARVPLEICVTEAACLHQPKPGIVGTTEGTQLKSDNTICSPLAASALPALVISKGH